jgi:serpin B
MAANGASGDTKQEILDVLQILDIEQYNIEIMRLIDSLNKNETVEFNVANSIWYNTDHFNDPELNFSDTYKKIISDCFRGIAGNINNSNGKNIINDWIALQTKGKIQNIVTDDIVKEALSFLVNTIYFKGDWAKHFLAEATRDDTFTDRNGNEFITAFMNQNADYSYYEDDRVQMLAKPYMDGNIQMYFVLPKFDETAQRTRYIEPYIFSDAVNNMTSEYCYFKLPKFKTEYLHDNLIDILKDMGIQAAFNEYDADFFSMYSKKCPENVFIGSILQKTFIEVDEKGTEAAAATVISMAPTSLMPTDCIDFICDRPFTYFIRDDATGEILFIGEYAFEK